MGLAYITTYNMLIYRCLSSVGLLFKPTYSLHKPLRGELSSKFVKFSREFSKLSREFIIYTADTDTGAADAETATADAETATADK